LGDSLIALVSNNILAIFVSIIELIMVRQMYYIFHGKHRLILANNQDQIKTFNPDFILDQTNYDPVKNALLIVQKNTSEKTIVLLGNPEELMEKILDKFRLIKAAGGLFFNAQKELLFIKRLDKWDLPKGKLEKNEDIETCATREVMEETGAKNIVIDYSLADTFHTYYLNDQWIIKQTHWFTMIGDEEQQFVPQAEEDIEEVKWMDLNTINLQELDTYPAIRHIINEYQND
jgi:8-oxo-dGTP pyrophosphatase MutT (NUDIX family)